MTDQMTKESACAMMGKTTEAHAKIEQFAGTFSAEVKMWMGPGEPMVSTGVMKNTMDLGGRFLSQVYKGDPSEGPFPNFEGRGFWGYNTIDERYEGVWIDTACTWMSTERGDIDASGKVWTMTGDMTNPETGKPMQKKTVITFQDDDHHMMEMFFTGPDGKETKSMEIAYERKG